MNDKVCKYDPDVKLFMEIGKAQLNVSGNQYRLTFDNGQMNLKLGDLVSCGGIDNGGRFVVVDVHSVYEKEDVADNPKIVNRMEVTVVPEISKDFAIPLPVDDGIKSCGSLRGSSHPYTGSKSNDAPVFSIRTATVHDSLDPYRMNQVKVTYEGDTYPSAEWVKVLTPFASKKNGISCKLVEGDKVLVCTIKTPNKEESFVVGSYYEGEDNTPPNGQRKFSTIIRSKNGQYIGFEESNDIFDFLGGFLPDGIKKLIETIFLSKKETWDTNEGSKTYNALGGIEMSDTYGLFTIAGSSSKRKITISSPFGTVGIDAAMGITISAPNGDIKIVGKNIDIEAGNNLTLKSGTNIDSSYYKNGFSTETILNNFGNSVSNAISDLFDFPALRFVVELLAKPIAGTLKIHSGRNLLLEANGTDAHFPDHKMSFDHVEKQIDDKVDQIVLKINKYIAAFKSYKYSINLEYVNLMKERKKLYDDISIEFRDKTNNNDVFTDVNLNALLFGWLTQEDVVQQNDVKERLVYVGPVLIDPLVMKNVYVNLTNKINKLRGKFVSFWNIDECCKSDFNNIYVDNQRDQMFDNYVKKTRDNAKKNTLMKQNDNYSESAVQLFVDNNKQNSLLRSGVMCIFDGANNDNIFKYNGEVGIDEEKWNSEEKWFKMIDSIELETSEWDNLKYGAANTVIDIANKILPLEAFSTRSWGKETKGQILMSQHVDSTLSINGQTLKEEFSGTSLGQLREAMRNATL